MNSEFILLVKSELGLNRVQVTDDFSLKQTTEKISQALNVPVEQLELKIRNQIITQLNNTVKLKNVAKLEDGLEVFVRLLPAQQLKQQPLAQNPQMNSPIATFASGKPVSQDQLAKLAKDSKEKQDQMLKQALEKQKLEEEKRKKEEEKKKEEEEKKKSQQPKHISFNEYLHDKKFKPTNISYKLDLNCKKHKPYPEGMCNQCIPPTAILKRQEYRHCDYVEFLNVAEISNFVAYWSRGNKTEQRVAFAYGYYANDPNYKMGIRAVVEALYEPPQRGHIGGFDLLHDPYQPSVDLIAAALGLKKIGWVFTTVNHDCFLSSQEFRMAAQFQQQNIEKHECGYELSRFLTIVLRTKKDDPEQVLPEVYMISDQGQALEKDNVFTDSQRRKVIQLRESKHKADLLPSIVMEGKAVTEFPPDFFIVTVAHGYNPDCDYNIIKISEFPVENRKDIQKVADLKQFLHKNQKKKSRVYTSDFHFLLYVGKLLDVDTALSIAEHVEQDYEVDQNIIDFVKQVANQQAH